ncbi:MAG: adenylate/guanylate cyclase domain-containing protein, partial [Actinomycetota bacterium]|nr:adenylate/guanylate cyclase domain-containing protein [Actinomycetota bacterium]
MSPAEVKVVVGIVGRISQRAQLSRWLAAAIDGQPVVVVVDGPPGVGKSTLVDWLVSQAAERGASHGVVTVPERGDVAEEVRIGAGVIDEQLRSGQPQLLVIDDAQWLDEAGQHQVEHMAFRLGTASLTGQPARVCLVLVVRDEATSSKLVSRLIDEPITRRLSVGALDDREARELARRISPGFTDHRTIARLVELSGGNPLTLGALADSISVGEVLPSPASTTGTIPVEVAWRARLSMLSNDALRAAVVIAMAENAVWRRQADDIDLLQGADAAVEELVAIGAVRRTTGGVNFTHPLLRTTALDLAPAEFVTEIAGDVLDRLEGASSRSGSAGTLVRLSATARRTGTEHHRHLVRTAFDEAIEHGSWSAAGDLAEYLAESALDLADRAHWLERLGRARFNELDRDEATSQLIEAADAYSESSSATDDPMQRADMRSCRAQCLLLAMRADFTRAGPRGHAELDDEIQALADDDRLPAQWRAHAASILAEATFFSPWHERRAALIEAAQRHARSMVDEGVDDVLTNARVQFAVGLHHLALLNLNDARGAFESGHALSLAQPDQWWVGGSLIRQASVELCQGELLLAARHASASLAGLATVANWAEHGFAAAVHAVALTRLSRFSEAEADSESALLSGRRADSPNPAAILAPIGAWRCAVRGDRDGLEAMLALARRHQLFIPFAEFVAQVIMDGSTDPVGVDPQPRWTPPRRDLGARNLGFHLAQIEAATIVGELEVVDVLKAALSKLHERGVEASFDWPTSLPAAIASAAIELGDVDASTWLDRARVAAVASGSPLDVARNTIEHVRWAFASGSGGQDDLDRARAALADIDTLGAPLLARFDRGRLTAVAGRLGASAGRLRTVMFTDIVDSTRLMASAGNAAWTVVLAEHHRIVRSTVTRFGGSVMTSTGDGFSAWFEHPVDAVAAAAALHEALDVAALSVPGGLVQVRIGVSTGPVFDLGADVSGMAVAEAARVMSTAGARQTH